ncbi:hypothetical protein AAFC00_004166 [Neodothiora populina]|uniref:Phosphatidylinositol N-acetylglucosaminyltransferase subunit H conserved domain-containing protein n=1 Tax=Neodothiora populina TaxID=2781224 RepID=A0ABR3PJ38_9PEZI
MLTIKRPTPTTVLYTVSSRSMNRTIPEQVQRYTTAILRILVGTFASLVLLQETKTFFPSHLKSLFLFSDYLILDHYPGQVAYSIASTTSWKWVVPLCLLTLWFAFRRGYTEESLLVIRGLGVQTSTSSPTYLSTSSTRFIPTSMVQDIFLYEAFKGFEVKFYLAIVVEGEEEVVVVFPSLLPERQVLEDVWRGARACLYEPKS